jgi:hypothetical protein
VTSAPPPPLRSYAWALETDGALSEVQKRVVRAEIRSAYLTIARGIVSSIGRRKPPLEPPLAPDSALARDAEEAAAEQGPALAGHGYRTFILGSALAATDGATLDPELFYVASLLHDSGMVTQVIGQDFTVRSGKLVLEVCGRSGTEPLVAEEVADAVVAHVTPGLGAEENALGYYVQCGAMADLAGLRMWDLPRGYMRQAYAAHPAAGVHAEVARLIRREARQVPEGRFALLQRGGMDKMVLVSLTRRYRAPGARAGL